MSSYCERYGGAVLNATIDLYAYATIEPLAGDHVIFEAADLGFTVIEHSDPADWELDGEAILHKAVYARIVNDHRGGRPFPCRITTYCEAPPGAGLGSSSTMVVAMVKGFVELLSLPLGEYDIARLAFMIERHDAGLAGGQQDQYAATFGGFNFIEFAASEQVIVNPLRVKNWILAELEASLVLFYTGVSRASATIIEQQDKNIASGDARLLEAMHRLKKDAFTMKEAVLKGDFVGFANVLNRSWAAKREMAAAISNNRIECLMDRAMSIGAVAGKVSGAGGGGFITFIADPARRPELMRGLAREDGQVMTCSFSKRGSEGWRIET